MLSPENITQMTDTIEHSTQTTDAIERLPRMLDRRSAVSEKRQSILQQRNTEVLPPLTAETPNARIAWRQVVQLREENRRLRFALEEQQAELQRLFSEYAGQPSEAGTGRLQEVMEERNQIQEDHAQLEQRYQELSRSFQNAVEEEAHKMVTAAAQTLELSYDETPGFLQDVVKRLEMHARQVEDKHLIEALYLKGEVQRMAAQLEEERKQLDQDRQQLFTMQHTAHQQVELHQKTLQSRLTARWKFTSAMTSLGVLATLIVLQFVFLFLLHVNIVGSVSFSIVAPVILCVVLAVIFAQPFTMLRDIYKSAPHKQRRRKNA